MDIIEATVSWTGPEHDQLTVLALNHQDFGADWSDDGAVTLLREIDPDGEVVGRLVGLEIDDFLHFDHWASIPDSHSRWKLPRETAAPLAVVLQRVQVRLRAAAHANALR